MSLPKEITVGQLREELKYRSREAMNKNWTFVFAGEILPEEHINVPFDQALEFVGQIAIPQKGRPGSITGAAQRLLKLWKEPVPTEVFYDQSGHGVDLVAKEEDVHPIEAVLRSVEKDKAKNNGFTPVVPGTEKTFQEVVEEKKKGQEPGVPDSLVWYRVELEKVRNQIGELSHEELTGKKGAELLKKSRFLEMKIALSEKPKKSTWEKVVDFVASLTGLDWVYLVTVGIADYGLIVLLKEMGLAAGVVYTLISFHALAMARSRKSQVTASRGIVAVWLLELLAFFVHLTLFNRRLWGSINELPFNVTEDLGDEYRPFLIAVILAVLFSAAGIYAVSTTLALLKERIDAEEYELEHGKQY